MSEVISYRLTGDWRHIVEDGLVDLDDLPDEALPTGHVEFIPVSPQVAVSGSPETAYTLASFKALIAAGVLTDLQGREGVQIAGWVGDTPVYWRAVTHLEYRGKKIPYPDVEFTLESDSRLTGIVASEVPGESATIYHPRIEALIDELDNKSDVGHSHQITDVEGLMQALEDASYSGGGDGGDGGPVSWTQVRNKPTTFPPSSHTHPLGDVSGLQAALDAKVGNTDPRLSDARDPKAHTHSWASLTGKPSTFPPDGHGHSISDVSGLQQALEDAANSGTGGGTGDGSPVTWISILNKPSEFPPEAHTHLIRDVSGLQGALDAKIGDTDPRLTDARTPKSHTHYWSEVTGKPLSFPPSTHTHQIGDTTGLQDALDAKVGNSDPRLSDSRTPTAHTHAITEITGLQASLDSKSDTGHQHQINDVDGLQAALDAAAAGSGGSSESVGWEGKLRLPNHPYSYDYEVPDPVEGDLFLGRSAQLTRFDGENWQLLATIKDYAIEEYQLINGIVSKVKLSQAVQDEIDGKADEDHTHTIADVVNLRDELDGKSNAGHTHGISDVSGLSGALADKVDDTDPRLTDARTPTAHTHAWSEVSDKPVDFPPSTHGHQISEINGLQDALDSKIEGTGEITPESLGVIERAGRAVTLWSGTQAEYDALPQATRHAVGFVGVIV